MEIVIHEPNRFNNNPLYIENQLRFDTMTDVKFINDTMLICANRQDATLYLIEIDLKLLRYTILSSLQCIFNCIPFRFDLLCVHENLIYGVELSNRIGVFRISDKKIIPVRCFQIEKNATYHGISVYDKLFILSGSTFYKKLTLYHEHYCKMKTLILPEHSDKSIKQTRRIGDNLIVSLLSTGSPKPSPIPAYDVLLVVYQIEPIECKSTLVIPNTHADDLCVYDGNIYVTAHSEGKGVILVCSYINNNIQIVKRIPVNEFPHGIDIRNGVMAYTSYKTSSVSILASW